MALNKNILGNEIYSKRAAFANKTADELIQEHGSIENARKAACIAEAEAIINHIKQATVTVPSVGFMAGNITVTGTSTTGTLS